MQPRCLHWAGLMQTHTNELTEVRSRLLDLHKAVIDAERLVYEKRHGRQAAGAFLEVLVNDPAFAWLRPWTALVVRMDDALDTAPGDADVAAERKGCVRAAKALIDT